MNNETDNETETEMDRMLRAAGGRSWTPEPELSETDQSFNDALDAARRGSRGNQLAAELMARG